MGHVANAQPAGKRGPESHGIAKVIMGMAENDRVEGLNAILEVLALTNGSSDPAAGKPHYGKTEEEAVAFWIAVHVDAWLRKWPGKQHALVTGVPQFGSPGSLYAHVTLVVGHDGDDDEFDVRVERLGSHALRVSIGNTLAAHFKAARNLPKRYSRVGQRQSYGDGLIGYVTLPTGGKGGL